MDKQIKIFKDDSSDLKFRKDGFIHFENAFDSKVLDGCFFKLRQLSPSDNFEANQKSLIPEQTYHCAFLIVIWNTGNRFLS